MEELLLVLHTGHLSAMQQTKSNVVLLVPERKPEALWTADIIQISHNVCVEPLKHLIIPMLIIPESNSKCFLDSVGLDVACSLVRDTRKDKEKRM